MTDFTALCTSLKTALQPLQPRAAVVCAFGGGNFSPAATLPTITIGIKDIEIYQSLDEVDQKNVQTPCRVRYALDFFIPKGSDSQEAYRLFADAAQLLYNASLAQAAVCGTLAFDAKLRHYRLSATVTSAIISDVGLQQAAETEETT